MTEPFDRLRELGRARDFQAAEILFLEGHVGDEVFLIEAGLVKVYVTAPNGDELILGMYGPGELLGEMAVLGNRVRSATGMGHTSGRLVEIPGDQFRSFLADFPDIMAQLLNIAQLRLKRADGERLSYLSDAVSARVARKLISWSQTNGRPRRDGAIEIIGMSHRDLAQSVAAKEKTVDEVLAALTAAGLIITGRRRFVLLDIPGLRNWADNR